ncbi:hypothetical protein Glove_490g44 [Diversispora epigaea]|uniref:Uncharacterized protein n=1 Tax=Diversispora epigaea TaxID=1348612 RepID=A0A397GK03_9GLOM|nr:hypothetical protein Glove_490g44 [Diversispora epigaea]
MPIVDELQPNAFHGYLKSAEGKNSSGQNNLGDQLETTKDEEKVISVAFEINRKRK